MNQSADITFLTDDGEKVTFRIIEQTTVNGCNYLLVEEGQVDEDSDDTMVYIMKADPQASAEEMNAYEFVEDETELLLVSKIFEQLMDDTDIVMD